MRTAVMYGLTRFFLWKEEYMKIVKQAPAKVNLFLRMDGKREDGYHLLYSVMQTVSVYDTIEVETVEKEKAEPQVRFSSNCSFLTNDPKKNTIVKAATLFLPYIEKENCDIAVFLDKKIPSQAGLGGGSSDAATVLLALNELFPGRVSKEELENMAIKIGADVPFFLEGGTVLCQGIGEIRTSLPSMRGIPMLLLKPAEGVSTPRCYAKFDEMGRPPMSEEEKEELYQAMLEEDGEKTPLFRARRSKDLWKNDLQAPAMTDVPVMQEGLSILSRGGALFSAMSGSGSALFGLFENEETIDRILSSKELLDLKKQGWWVQKAETV